MVHFDPSTRQPGLARSFGLRAWMRVERNRGFRDSVEEGVPGRLRCGEVHQFKRIRFAVPATHAGLFGLAWLLYCVQSQPLLDGPAAWPFGVVFLADFPLSAVCFGIMFTAEQGNRGIYALITWGLLGTVWWFLLGCLIESCVRRFRRDSHSTS